MIRLQQVKLPVTHTKEELERAIEKILHVSSEQIKAYEIIKQSLDARKKAELKYSYVIDTEILKEQKVVKQCRNKNVSLIEKKKYVFPKSGSQPLRQRPVVVGARTSRTVLRTDAGTSWVSPDSSGTRMRCGDTDERCRAVLE